MEAVAKEAASAPAPAPKKADPAQKARFTTNPNPNPKPYFGKKWQRPGTQGFLQLEANARILIHGIGHFSGVSDRECVHARRMIVNAI